MEDYNDNVKHIRATDRLLSHMLKQYKDNRNKNTIKLELDIKKGLKELNTKLEHIYEDYITSSRYKNNLPDREYQRRVNEIISFKNGYDNLNKEYNDLINSKYEYVRT
jgi:hypothetical protein